MILPETAPLKGNGAQPPPPAYGTPPPPPTFTGPSDDGFYQFVHAPPRYAAAKRFLKAFFVALAVWVLLAAVVGTSVDVVMHMPGRWASGHYDIDSRLSLHECLDFFSPSTSASSSQAHFSASVPISDTMLLLGSGELFDGHVEILVSPLLRDAAQFNVTATYSRRDIAGRAKICQIQRSGGESGLGIFTPRGWLGPKEKLRFDIQITLPLLARTEYFEANIPNLSFHTSESVGIFESFSIKTANAEISVGTLTAQYAELHTSNGKINAYYLYAKKSASVQTSNARIEGHYHSSASLELLTSNEVIDTTVTMSALPFTELNLTIATSNARLASTIHLVDVNSSAPVYANVNTHTTNGDLLVKIPSIPLGAILTYRGTSSNALANVELSPTYEGTFNVTSSTRTPVILLPQQALDPAGLGRQRVVRKDVSRVGAFSGVAYWGDESGLQGGNVIVESSFRRIALVL